jgi:hypothetical protein
MARRSCEEDTRALIADRPDLAVADMADIRSGRVLYRILLSAGFYRAIGT